MVPGVTSDFQRKCAPAWRHLRMLLGYGQNLHFRKQFPEMALAQVFPSFGILHFVCVVYTVIQRNLPIIPLFRHLHLQRLTVLLHHACYFLSYVI